VIGRLIQLVDDSHRHVSWMARALRIDADIAGL
jgi:hypothetical protein